MIELTSEVKKWADDNLSQPDQERLLGATEHTRSHPLSLMKPWETFLRTQFNIPRSVAVFDLSDDDCCE